MRMEFHEVEYIMRETLKEIKRADKLLREISKSSHPSVLHDLVEPTLALKEKLLIEIEELEKAKAILKLGKE